MSQPFFILAETSIAFGTVAVSALCSLGAALLSSWVTSRLSRRTSAHTKRWEKRQETYSNIIEALHQISTTYDMEFANFREDSTPTEARDILATRKSAFIVLKRAVDLGGWDVCTKVASEVKKYLRNYPDTDPLAYPPQESLNEAARAWEARGNVIEFANADLKAHSLQP